MDIKAVEKSILHYTNKERKKRGLSTLRGDPHLIRAARRHSRWMAKWKEFSHTGSKGSQPWDRAKKAGYMGLASENIWRTDTSRRNGIAYKSKFVWNNDRKLGKAAVISWMNSPGHRRNMLSEEWEDIGIRVATSNKGITYITQNFGDDGYYAGNHQSGEYSNARTDLNSFLAGLERKRGNRYSTGRLAMMGKKQKDRQQSKRKKGKRRRSRLWRKIKTFLGIKR